MRSSRSAILMVSLIGIAVAGFSCGGDDKATTATPSPSPAPTNDASHTSGDTSAGSIVPNTFMTYNGAKYRLVDLLQANLIDQSGFAQAGQATQSDVTGDGTVYTRTGDGSSVYTFSPGTDVPAPSGEENLGTPALWYRWEPEG